MNLPDASTRVDVIRRSLQSTSAAEVIRELHAALAPLPAVVAPLELLRAFATRHQLGATCLDADVAVVHARTSGVSRLVVAAGRSDRGIHFDAEHPSIRLVFAIAVPSADITDYLLRIAQLTRLLRNAETRAELLAAPTDQRFRRALSGPPLACV